ncbi:MAG: flagellar biosynthesis protein FlhF [Halioglobus sp.]
MKIKRFQGKDSRSAMTKVREDLGAEAMILSNKSVNGQVEIVAALEIDEADLSAVEIPPPPFLETAASIGAGEMDSLTLSDLQRELANLRGMLEGKLSQLSWRETANRPSAKAALHNRLVRLGLSRALCGVIADLMPAHGNLEEYWHRALEMLAGKMAVMESDSLINNGGIVALMGSTGVGKTTTVAKLAARFVLRYGCKEIALITTDCYRIGGQEQLQTFADYLGVQMVVATDGQQLKTALDELSPRKLILIDSAGMSQRDLRLHEQFATLNSVGHDIDTYVVLSATAQQRALHEVVNVFGKNNLAGAMITKVDESVGLGGVLDVVIKNRLKLAYISEGQKVPEDIRPAEVNSVIKLAIDLMDQDAAYQSSASKNTQLASSAAVRN